MSTPDVENASPSQEHSEEHSEDEDADEMSEDKTLKTEGEEENSPSQAGTNTKPATNPKDPNRQKRKKARRACLACQRAHLTCSDERPCERCIRRGLGDACQDGVRKKAKYLQDAPNEALIPPGMAGPFHRQFGGEPPQLAGMSPMMEHHNGAGPNAYFAQAQSVGMYPQTPDQLRMPPPGPETPGMGPYSGTTTPISPPAYGPNQNPNQTPPMQSINAQLNQALQSNQAQMQGMSFDPSDPALFNFDLASLNFGNHYGALEFGMLGHMSSGAGETPSQEASNISPLQQAMYHSNNNMNYGDGSANMGGYDSIDWQIAHSRQNSSTISNPNSTPLNRNSDTYVRQDGFPHAYSVAQGGNSMSASPGSTGQDVPASFDNPPQSPAFFNPQQPQHPYQQRLPSQQQHHQQQQGYPNQAMNRDRGLRKRRRDTRAIYEDIKQPYPYTQAFHRFIKLIESRFPKEKKERVGRAMAVIRPSFLSCMKDLDEQDLVHQEQTFQRKLWGYETSLENTGTPSLIIRRSGEVAAVGKEFCLLSGWPQDVLLGRLPNKNINLDSLPAQHQSAVDTDREMTSPDDPPPPSAHRALNPVMIAELLDHDSVINFYDDFARLAFNDARGFADRRVRLMRYRAPSDTSSNGIYPKRNEKVDDDGVEESKALPVRRHERGDTIECQMRWCVWHDQFDMPSMIVMNFLPILAPSPESLRQPAGLQQREAMVQHVAPVR